MNHLVRSGENMESNMEVGHHSKELDIIVERWIRN